MARTIRQFETLGLISHVTPVTGSDYQDVYVISGSRLLAGLNILSIDVATTVSVDIQETADLADGYSSLLTFSGASVGRLREIVSDFHNQLRIVVTVSGGSAAYKLAVSIFDNALTTRIENANINVDINASRDSVRLGNGSNLGEVFSDGSIPVVSKEAPDERLQNTFNAVSAVMPNVETQIASVLIPAGKTGFLAFAEASGENIAQYTVYLNGSPLSVKRTYFTGGFNVSFPFQDNHTRGLPLVAGDLVTLTVYQERDPANFDGRLVTILKD